MKCTFYFDELKEYGIDTVIPNSKEIEIVNHIIMAELSKNIINEESKKTILRIMQRMMNEDGVDGIILGCTELPLIINQSDTTIPLFDTTEIHTDYIVDYTLR